MIAINKQDTPEVLLRKQKEAEEQQLNSNDAYRSLSSAEKRGILENLMREQGHLCAYCMRRLPDERVPQEERGDIPPVTIEHWLPRNPGDNTEEGQGLDYNNLFAVCSGNRRKRPNRRKNGALTCDAKRKAGYEQLVLNPCNAETIESLYYTENGLLRSDDPRIMDDIQVKLNLNCCVDMVNLPGIRAEILTAFQLSIPEGEQESLLYCEKALKDFENETDPKTEYVGIVIWWLKNYLEKSR